MSKPIRIKATPNGDDKYIKVELKQDFDLLEILSLKIKQSDVYNNFCSDYGVVAGRVIINNGFGVPNVKVSIFIPRDTDDGFLKQIYPYKSTNKDEKNVNGIRYNLLPDTQQNFNHTPVGTFPSKAAVLDDKTSLEIFDRYYKYTTITNESGDFILFGVPTGQQVLHYDMDVSDIGFISARPFELINQGFSKELFESPFKYKGSRNIDSLAQIISANVPITVEPFWCDSLSTGRIIGITREDINIDSLELIPTAMFFGSIFSDDEKDSLNKNCRPRKKMGQMNELITSSGDIEAIYRTPDGDIDKFEIEKDIIDDNGNWAIQLPMNLRKVVTDEFGNLVPSPDGIKGIATEADFRFRISMDATSQDKRLRQRANFLVPNLTGNYKFGVYDADELSDGNPYKINQQLSTFTQNTPYSADTGNQYNYLEEFYTFRWKKVYSVKQFIGRYQSNQRDENRNFTGIKDIIEGAGVNKFPTNRMDTNINVLYTIICFLLTLFGNLVGIINGIINLINGLVTGICQVRIPCGFSLIYCFRAGISICNQNYKNKCAQVGCSGGTPNACGKCRCTDDADPPNFLPAGNGCGNEKVPYFDLELKWKCILAKPLCKNCKRGCSNVTPQEFSCCRSENPSYDNLAGCPDFPNGSSSNDCMVVSPGEKCCLDCCVKVPLIKLTCDEEQTFGAITPTHIKSPFASDVCNKNYVKINNCSDCSGRSTQGVRDWVACKLEGLARWLNMLRFDFYNDWVSGSLYFPLFKRKYKVRTRKKGQGDVRKDKFCDFDCADEYQTPATYKKYRYKLKNNNVFKDTDINVNGCKVTFKANFKYITNWYGEYGANPSAAQAAANLSAREEIVFKGVDSNLNGCSLKFSESAVSQAVTQNQDMTVILQDRTFPGPHGKPKYIKTEDPLTGLDTWENVGGHAHHQNKCNTVYRVERGEYFRDIIGCDASVNNNTDDDTFVIDDGIAEENLVVSNNCDGSGCNVKCTLGVKPCNIRCDCNQQDNYNDPNIKHGLIKEEDDVVYYASIINNSQDPAFNNNEYKANLLFPTDIVEMGSSVFCDIDDVPFIISELSPTTFQVSEESAKFKLTGNNIDEVVEKDSGINLRGYVDFGCKMARCVNTRASVIQSQIGVDLIDKTDIGMEIGTCSLYFDHDEDVREYFCRRFSVYKNNSLDINYMRPGSEEFDNIYTPYIDIQLTSTPTPIYTTNNNQQLEGTINDGDLVTSGDRCGLKNEYTPTDYFYGVGVNGGFDRFTDFPNAPIDTFTNPEQWGVTFNSSQTPYHMYFGIVPGKTALHKLVSQYFADRINEITLQGVGNNEKAAQNRYNQPNFRNEEQNKFSLLKTCLGESEIKPVGSNSGGGSNPTAPPGSGLAGQIINNFLNNFPPSGMGNNTNPPGGSTTGAATINGGNSSSVNCGGSLTESSTIEVTSLPAVINLEVYGGSNGNNTTISGGFNLHILGPGGAPPSIASPNDVLIVDNPNTLPQGAMPGSYGVSISSGLTYGGGTTKWYCIEFATVGTYRIDYSYSCIGGNPNGYVTLTT